MFTRSQNTARLGTRHRITTFGPAQKRLLQASVAVAGPTARGGLHSAPVAGRPTHSIEHDAEAVEQGRPSPGRARTSWNKHDGCPLAARVRLHLANHLLQRAHFDLPQPRHGIYVSTPQEASSVSCRLATTGDTPIRQKTALRRLENLVWYCACSDNRCLGTSDCSSPQTGHKMPVQPTLTEPCDTVPGAGQTGGPWAGPRRAAPAAAPPPWPAYPPPPRRPLPARCGPSPRRPPAARTEPPQASRTALQHAMQAEPTICSHAACCFKASQGRMRCCHVTAMIPPQTSSCAPL